MYVVNLIIMSTNSYSNLFHYFYWTRKCKLHYPLNISALEFIQRLDQEGFIIINNHVVMYETCGKSSEKINTKVCLDRLCLAYSEQSCASPIGYGRAADSSGVLTVSWSSYNVSGPSASFFFSRGMHVCGVKMATYRLPQSTQQYL